MILREFLDEREAYLTELIAGLRLQLAPLEAELAELRRAKSAIGATPRAEFDEQEAPRFPNMGELINAVEVVRGLKGEDLRQAMTNLRGLLGGLHVTFPALANITMKELVIKALSEHFHNGAPTRVLLEFFRDAWGRNIERSNLSPQLSRLYQEGLIGRIPSTKGWFLIPPGTVVGFRPYLSDGVIAWKEPATATDRDEPLLTREIQSGNDPEDD